MLVSVVVPVLNEARELPGLLDHLAALPGRFEAVIADGGSTDGSAGLARAHPSRPVVVEGTRGRAAQLNDGASRTHGDVLVFLHADSRLPSAAYATLATALAEPAVVGGNFALRFDGDDTFARTLTAVYAVQRRLGIYYGDSALWARRDAVHRLGGFRPVPIMDDYDFARRLERLGPTLCLPGPALTSSRRWRRAGVARTLAAWVVIRWLYLAGVSPERLAGLYRQVR